MDIRRYRGGDSLTVVNEAVRELQLRSVRHGRYVGQAIFLDADRRWSDQDRTNEADRLIAKYQFHPIWSNPSFEALLLRHLVGCEDLQPPTTKMAFRELKSRWPKVRYR